MNEKLKKAHKFVKEKHKGQKRKFTKLDYITHLENTANLLYGEVGNIETDDLVAALLHDVVEDTGTELKEVGKEFGGVVMRLVEELTSDKTEQNSKGKAIYLTEKINGMSERAFTIKLCDRLDNIMGLERLTGFTERYIKETRYIIEHIDREINDIQKNLLRRIKAMLLYLELVYEM